MKTKLLYNVPHTRTHNHNQSDIDNYNDRERRNFGDENTTTNDVGNSMVHFFTLIIF